MEEKLYYEINGNMGTTLKVYETYCTISMTNGGKALLFKGIQGAMAGEKKFFYSDITGTQFKNLGMTTGYLQFEFPGANSINAMKSENSFTFSATIGTSKHKELKEKMQEVADFIKEKIHNNKNNSDVISGGSVADELLKFKQLLDSGIISQEEFDKKKQELLNQ